MEKRIKVNGWVFRNTGEIQTSIGWFVIPEEQLRYHEDRNQKWLDADTVEALGLSPVGEEYSAYSVESIMDGKSNAEIKAEIKKHLENLGFVVGGNVRIVNRLGNNVIVNVKDARVAISQEMAMKIMI